METMVGVAICIVTLFVCFQFRGVAKKEAKSMEAEASANYAKRYTKAVVKANKYYESIHGKGLKTLDDIEALLEGNFTTK